MTILERFAHTGIIPVVVIDKISDAVSTAKALLAEVEKLAGGDSSGRIQR